MYVLHTICFDIVVLADADKKPIKVEDFAEHLAMLQSNMNQQFRADYDSLVSDAEYTFHAAKLGVNMTKNRYKNILPCKSVVVFGFFKVLFCFQMITPEWF